MNQKRADEIKSRIDMNIACTAPETIPVLLKTKLFGYLKELELDVHSCPCDAKGCEECRRSQAVLDYADGRLKAFGLSR